MTDTKQPEALMLADRLDANASGGNVTTMDEERAIAQTLRRLHAENEALASKLKVYEDLDEADSDVQLLRMGYAAARLEIESLNARIKGLIAERDAAYEVAMMNTESGAAWAKAAQAAGEYPPLPDPDASTIGLGHVWTRHSMRAYVDADRAMRAQAAHAAVAGPVMTRNRTKYDILHFMTKEQIVEEIIRLDAALAAAPTKAAPVAQGDALTYEQSYAIRQGHEIAASDSYFDARPQIDNNDRRKVFEAGFERGWDAARAQAKEGANHG